MVITRALLAGGCLLILSTIAGAQETPAFRAGTGAADTLRSVNSLATLFDNSYNTYHWRASGILQTESNGLAVSVSDQFLSSIIRTERTFITDQQLFDLLLRETLTGDMRAVVHATSFLLSDDQSVNLSKLATETVYGGVSYRASPSLTVEPLIGFIADRQISPADEGITYSFSAAMDTTSYNGYRTSFTGLWRYDQMSPRRQETRNAGFVIDKTFFEQTRNYLSGFYNETRRDVYVPADPGVAQEYGVYYNIETRTESDLGVTDTLRYGLSRGVQFTLHGLADGTEVDRSMRYLYSPDPTRSPLPTTVNELRLESSAQLDYAPLDSTRGMIRIEYDERDEQHTLTNPGTSSPAFPSLLAEEERKNNQSRRTILAGNIASKFTAEAGATLSASASILRYDTPSLENDDDRDELRYLVSLTSYYRINRYLLFQLESDVTLMHLVYLASTRSASNTWNRVARLMPSLEYRPVDRFSTFNQFEVLANYTVYDYEFGSAPIQSFAYRQFSWQDSTALAVTGKIGASWFHNLKFYEQGEFQWDDFSERPVAYYEDKLYVATIWYAMHDGLLFSAGFRYFSQLRFSYKGADRFPDHFLRSVGPLTGIKWVVGSHTSFSIDGWYERQHQDGEPDQIFTTMTMNLFIHI
ncbi:MAG TPA: hypothetical protein VMW43_13300 [Bacteroidota bacterium]|nr:hypothetical protein [Bacteroidota bacterium]